MSVTVTWSTARKRRGSTRCLELQQVCMRISEPCGHFHVPVVVLHPRFCELFPPPQPRRKVSQVQCPLRTHTNTMNVNIILQLVVWCKKGIISGWLTTMRIAPVCLQSLGPFPCSPSSWPDQPESEPLCVHSLLRPAE